MGYYTFPHTRTYDSDLGWLICQTKKLLEMYNKWDQLPDMIKEILQEYIETGEINDIIEDIIGDFILNPKYPPSPDIPKASGDGSTDDTASIQGCIDYAAEHGKLGVYFPTGAYLTGSLTLKAGVSLFGSDRYTTRIVLKAGATSPLLSGNVSNMGIHRLTLDSNAGNQVNNITTVSITAGTDIEFSDLIFASGYVNLSYLGISGHLQLSDIIFANAVFKHLLITGTADVQAENLMFENLSAVSGNCCMDISTDRGSYRFTSKAATPACIRCSGTGNRFEGFIFNAVENIVDTGTGNDFIIYGQSQTETISGDKKLTAANITEQISGDKTVNAGDISETAANKTVHVTQDMTEQVDGNITITAGNISETATGKTETIAENKTVSVTGDSSETIGGNKTVSVTGTHEFTGSTFKVSTSNPLGYRAPTDGNIFDTIPMASPDSTPYNVLVENENTKRVTDDIITEYGTLFEKLVNGGTVIQIGDSLGEGLGWWNYEGTPAKSEENDGMFAVLRKQFPRTKWANYAVSGATFMQGSNDLDKQIDRITESSADLLVVIAGINDINYLIEQGNVDKYGKISPSWAGVPEDPDRSTFLGAIDYTMNKLESKFPNTPVIYILTSTSGRENNDPTNASYWTLKNLIKISMHRWNCRIFDCRKYLNYCYDSYSQKYYWQQSRLHYSEEGYKYLANYFSRFIIGSGSDFNFDYEWILPVYGNSTDEIITNMQDFNQEVFNGAFTIRNGAGILLPSMMSSYAGSTAGFVFNPLFDDFALFTRTNGELKTYRPPCVKVIDEAVTSLTENMTYAGLYVFSNLTAVTENIPQSLKSENSAFVLNYRYNNLYHGYITPASGKKLYVYNGTLNSLEWRTIDLNLGDNNNYMVTQSTGNKAFTAGENTLTPSITSGFKIVSAAVKVNNQLASTVTGFTDTTVTLYVPTETTSDYTLTLTLMPTLV